MTRAKFRNRFAPADPEAALVRIENAITTLKGVEIVELLWFRDALKARREGLVQTIDQALSLKTIRREKGLRRKELLAQIFAALQPASRHSVALKIATWRSGGAVRPECQAAFDELRLDCPRSVRQIERLLPPDV